MVTHAINRQAFEFSCASEDVANELRVEIDNVTSVQINQIISAVLQEMADTGDDLKIETMEIDLGDVSMEDFGKTAMLDEFKQIFKQKITDCQFENHNVVERSDATDLQSGELELTQLFLLHGDVPWWADKNSSIQLDKMLEKVIESHPHSLKRFLNKHGLQMPVLIRIAQHYKPATKLKIGAMISSMPDLKIKNLFGRMVNRPYLRSLSIEKLLELQSLFENFLNNSFHTLRQSLIARIALLEQRTNLQWIPFLLSALNDAGVTILPLHTEKTPDLLNKKLKEIKRIINGLDVFQMEFLLLALTAFSESISFTGNASSLYFENDPNSIQNKSFLKYQPLTGINDVNADNQLESGEPLHISREVGADEKNTIGYPMNDQLQIPMNGKVGLEAEDAWSAGYPVNDPLHIPVTVNLGSETEDARSASGPIPSSQQDFADATGPSLLSTEVTELLRAIENFELHDDAVPEITQNSSHVKETEILAGASAEDAGVPVSNEEDHFKGNNIHSPKNHISGNSDIMEKEATSLLDQEPEANNPVLVPPLPGKDENTILANNESSNASVNKFNQQDISALINDRSKNKGKINVVDLTDADNSGQLHRIAGKIAFIMMKLKSGSETLLHHLQKMNEEQLDNLANRFHQHATEGRKWMNMIKKITDHPYFLKYSLLNLFVNLSFENLQQNDSPVKPLQRKVNKQKERLLARYSKKIQISQADLLTFVDNLSLKELAVLKEAFQKKKFERAQEKKVIRKLLHRLPAEALILMKYLTELYEEEIRQLVSPENDSGPAVAAFENNDLQNEPSIIYNKNEEGERKIIVENAGLCLLANYLPGLFKRLGYVENKMFKSEAIASRALYLLQNMVTGKNKSAEYALQFNKLLCGFDVNDAILGGSRLTENEILEGENLLSSAIENWNKLKSTSITGFRESFLQRKGILIEKEASWSLVVERKGFDMLLNTIPWGFGLIKLPWMKKHINVEW